ncbi:MAG: hypothetical protein JNM57_14045 [Cyclobacteriaceae bacterium]|nr:hypothetical protein [Cyclobacteriaceae bacterium]
MSAKLFRFVLMAFVLVGISSCEKDEALNKRVLDKIIFHENVDQVGKYVYNSDGKIMRYEYYFDKQLVEYYDFIYNREGKLVTKAYFEKKASGAFVKIYEDVLTYNASGQNDKITLGGPAGTKYFITWDGDKISRIDYITSYFGVEHRSFFVLEYDANKNVSQTTYYTIEGEDEIFNFVVNYEYDEKDNPKANFPDPYDLINNYNTPNNVVKIIQRSTLDGIPHTITDIVYQYNEFNLPTEKTETINSYGSVSEIHNKFFYKII